MTVAALRRELDAWADAGRTAEFWWRDDDLGSPTARLDPLLRTAAALGAEPLLAIVPHWATADLPSRLAGAPARVAVHGWAHVDHQSGRGKKAEFGDARPLEALLSDAIRGRERLEDLFDLALLPCFVPPWNRITPDLIDILPRAGYRALSGFGAGPTTARNLVWINTHVDVIDWRGDRRFIGTGALARTVTRDLSLRREEQLGTQPIGLLTHHLEMNDADWNGFRDVCDILVTHPAARMVSSGRLFERSGAHD